MTGTPYQDRLSPDGGCVVTGYRECAGRFATVAAHLPTLSTPLTVLDFGANAGYFSLRLAREHGAHCTAIDRDPVIRTARHPRVKVIHQSYRAADVAALPRHDVVLALSVLHHTKDWRALLTALRGRARHLLLVETPHPDEVLRHAAGRTDLARLDRAVAAWGTRVGEAPGVRSRHPRGLYAIPTGAWRGTVFTGNGYCSSYWRSLVTPLAEVLGYTPFPGSLNLQLAFPAVAPATYLLGPPRRRFWDQRRPKRGPRGGDYQFWPARFGHGQQAVNGHIMIPGQRGHGPGAIEMIAPIPLRETWGIVDGDTLWVHPR